MVNLLGDKTDTFGAFITIFYYVFFGLLCLICCLSITTAIIKGKSMCNKKGENSQIMPIDGENSADNVNIAGRRNRRNNGGPNISFLDNSNVGLRSTTLQYYNESSDSSDTSEEDSEDEKTLTAKDYDVWMPLVVFNTPEKVKIVQDELCSICLDHLLNNTPVRKIKLCKHLFHDECLTDWLKVNETCPNCKENLAKGAMQDKQRKLRKMRNLNKRSLKKIDNTLASSNKSIHKDSNLPAPNSNGVQP